MDDILIDSSGSPIISGIIPRFDRINPPYSACADISSQLSYDSKTDFRDYSKGYPMTCAPSDLELIAEKFSQEIERLEGRMHQFLEEKDWTISFLERRVESLEALVFEMKRQLEDSVPRVLLSKEDAPFVDLLADLEDIDDD